jgi:glycerophosphoryl diester phosphodiesterase
MPDFLGKLMAKPIAHRGLHNKGDGVIENSHAAFSAAVERGYGIECDVQITADGEAVVFHDYDLDRLTNETGRVDARKAGDLGQITLKGSGAGDGIFTLGSMLALVRGRVPIVVEIKSRFDGDLRLTRRVAEIVQQHPDHPITVESFDPRIVAALRVMLPEHPRGIVAMARYDYPDYAALPADEKHAMANLLHFTEMQPDFVSWNVKDLPHAAPHLCRAGIGLPISVWTVRTPDDVARATAHADQIVFEGFLPDENMVNRALTRPD